MKGFWNNKSHFGLDIGSSALKGILLVRSKNRVRLKNYFYQEMEEFPSENALQKSLKEQLSALIEIHELQGKNVFSAIPDTELFVFQMKLPQMPLEELEIAIRNEVENRLNFSLEEATIDFLEPSLMTDEEGNASYAVTAYCSRIITVEAQIKRLKDVKLIPESIESDMLANIATLDFNEYLSSPESSDIVIELGHNHSSIALVKDKQLLHMNTLPLGRKLIKKGVDSAGLNTIDENKVTQDYYQKLFLEIKKSVDYFKSSISQTSISKILLIGSPDPQIDVTSLLSEFIKIPAEFTNPFKNIDIYNRRTSDSKQENVARLASYFSVAVGLALRGLS